MVSRIAACFLTLAIALVTLPVSASAQEAADIVSDIRAWRGQHEVQILQETRALLSMPNHASSRADILANARLLVDMLEARGAEALILEAGDSSPAVYGEINVPDATLTLMVYAHFDGQPVTVEDWDSPPFEPLLFAGSNAPGNVPLDWDSLAAPIDPEARLYARSSSDDKTPIIAVLAALDGLQASGHPLSVNLKFFLEGEEEAGSQHLPDMLRAHADRLDADIWMFADGPVDPRGEPRVMLGVRGAMGFGLTVFGPVTALHSGHFGNVAPNPGARLAHLITSMRDPSGRILIDGLSSQAQMTPFAMDQLRSGAFDEAAMLDQAGIAFPEWGEDSLYGEAISYPSLNVLALSMGPQDGSASNTIHTEARGRFGLRLTPGLSVDFARQQIRQHILDQGYILVEDEPTSEQRRTGQPLARLEFTESGYGAAQTDPDDPLVQRLIALVDAADERPLRVVPLLGGSLPLAPLQEILDARFVIVPMVNADNNQHAANENLRIANFWYGIEAYAVVLALLGREHA